MLLDILANSSLLYLQGMHIPLPTALILKSDHTKGQHARRMLQERPLQIGGQLGKLPEFCRNLIHLAIRGLQVVACLTGQLLVVCVQF